MPELAEVEFYRKQWDPGLSKKVTAVEARPNRVFRGSDLPLLARTLSGATLLGSAAHGKQMLFRFSKNAWLGIHLGMTGELKIVPVETPVAKHDRLILRQKNQALVFNDPRQFGRVLFEISREEPAWWQKLPAQILSPQFTLVKMTEFLNRHARAPMKAALLLQAGFPGIGNWMADEILWQAKINPRRPAGSLNDAETQKLFSDTLFVTRGAMRTVGKDWRDLPDGWLFHVRWRKGGACPRDKTGLRHATIGGRTTCWCPTCQPEKKLRKT
jgi:formamidopyrimidine-DNA glycosylase